MPNWKRDAQIYRERLAGHKFIEIGGRHGVSPGRAREIFLDVKDLRNHPDNGLLSEDEFLHKFVNDDPRVARKNAQTVRSLRGKIAEARAQIERKTSAQKKMEREKARLKRTIDLLQAEVFLRIAGPASLESYLSSDRAKHHELVQAIDYNRRRQKGATNRYGPDDLVVKRLADEGVELERRRSELEAEMASIEAIAEKINTQRKETK